jgi:sugar lactone lactonase YvrE
MPGRGRPDGLTIDSEGGVWVAINNGGEASGRPDARGSLPCD